MGNQERDHWNKYGHEGQDDGRIEYGEARRLQRGWIGYRIKIEGEALTETDIVDIDRYPEPARICLSEGLRGPRAQIQNQRICSGGIDGGGRVNNELGIASIGSSVVNADGDL